MSKPDALTKVQCRPKEGVEETYSLQAALEASKKAVIQGSMDVLLVNMRKLYFMLVWVWTHCFIVFKLYIYVVSFTDKSSCHFIRNISSIYTELLWLMTTHPPSLSIYIWFIKGADMRWLYYYLNYWLHGHWNLDKRLQEAVIPSNSQLR